MAVRRTVSILSVIINYIKLNLFTRMELQQLSMECTLCSENGLFVCYTLPTNRTGGDSLSTRDT